MATHVEAPVTLEAGDTLTREEFHRRYLARPDIKKAELIDGVVYVPSPTRFTWHDQQAALMIFWLSTYAIPYPEIHVGGSATIYLDEHNEVQPDAFMFRPEPDRSPIRITEDGYLEGAPQLVVEVAASSASYDLHQKLEAYRRNQVQEYIVWRVLDDAIDWFRWRNGEFVRLEPDAAGVIESEVFPGLRLDLARLLAGDRAGLVAALRV